MTTAQSRRETAQRAVGITVGQRWTLLGVIGHGGTATVYEAAHRNGSRVAVKMLHADFNSHEQVRRRFLAEGYAANRVRHEGAVKVLDDGETDAGGAFLVMELLEGETLAARLLRDGPLPSAQVLKWGIAVLEILASAHEHHVVHRDVKPSNIFITRRDEAKLLDFGIARISAEAGGYELDTQEGVALGTPAFMAPEQATGSLDQIGAATDVWGVGATMFQLLTGRPVQEPTRTSTDDLTAPPVRAFAPNVLPELAKVIDRALSLRASDRWPTARAMIQALELARQAPLEPTVSGGDTLTEDVVMLPKPAVVARQSVMFATLSIVLVLAGGGYWVLHRSVASPAPNPPQTTAVTAPIREAPIVAVSAAPSSVDTAVSGAVQSASVPKISMPISQERPRVATPIRKRSEALPPPASAQPASVSTPAVSGPDTFLERRK